MRAKLACTIHAGAWGPRPGPGRQRSCRTLAQALGRPHRLPRESPEDSGAVFRRAKRVATAGRGSTRPAAVTEPTAPRTKRHAAYGRISTEGRLRSKRNGSFASIWPSASTGASLQGLRIRSPNWASPNGPANAGPTDRPLASGLGPILVKSMVHLLLLCFTNDLLAPTIGCNSNNERPNKTKKTEQRNKSNSPRLFKLTAESEEKLAKEIKWITIVMTWFCNKFTSLSGSYACVCWWSTLSWKCNNCEEYRS